MNRKHLKWKYFVILYILKYIIMYCNFDEFNAYLLNKIIIYLCIYLFIYLFVCFTF